MTPADLIKKYVELRDWLERDTKAAEERQAPYKQAMQTIEGALQKHLLDNNLENVKSEFGTAYQTTLTSVKLADRATFTQFAREQIDGYDYFTNAVSKEKIKDYTDEHGTPPPGIDLTFIHKLNVRRS